MFKFQLNFSVIGRIPDRKQIHVRCKTKDDDEGEEMEVSHHSKCNWESKCVSRNTARLSTILGRAMWVLLRSMIPAASVVFA